MTPNEKRLAQALVDEAHRAALEGRVFAEDAAYASIAAVACVGVLFLVLLLWYLVGSLVGYHSDSKHWRGLVRKAEADYADALARSDFDKTTDRLGWLERQRAMEPDPPLWAVWIRPARSLGPSK
jgi:hypothetical protein